MAKYEITYKCGHEETVELFGSNNSRERKIAQLESHECPACRAAKANANSNMATLEGSDKQISWAGDIRTSMMRELEKFIAAAKAEATKRGFNDEQMAIVDANGEKVINYVKAQTSSRWFIDNRDRRAQRIADEILKG